MHNGKTYSNIPMRSSANLYQFLKEQRLLRPSYLLDKSIYIISIGGPSMTIPQVLKIWTEKNAGGISVVAWVGYTVFAILWLFYGMRHNLKPIIVTNLTIIILNSLVIAGTLAYR
jgi:uncharacterized protein with PQ loop repeat